MTRDHWTCLTIGVLIASTLSVAIVGLTQAGAHQRPALCATTTQEI